MKNYLVSLIIIATAYLSVQAEVDLSIVWQKKSPVVISNAKWSADGNFIYCAVHNNIHKIDAKTGEFVSAFKNTLVSGIYDMKISGKGNYIVTTNGSGGINLWDINIEQSIKYLRFPTTNGSGGAYCVDISPDEKFVIIGIGIYKGINEKGDYYMIRYDLNTQTFSDSIKFDYGCLEQISVSHDGTKLATGSFRPYSGTYFYQVIIWDTDTWSVIGNIENVKGDGIESYRRISFSNEDKLLYFTRHTSPPHSKVYDLSLHQFIASSDTNRISFNLEVLPDNLSYLIMYSSWDGYHELELHDFKSNKKSFDYRGDIIESYGDKQNYRIFYGGYDTIYIFENVQTQISDLDEGKDFNLTLLNNELTIYSPNVNYQKYYLIISDLTGNVIIKDEKIFAPGENKYTLKSFLPTGFYICRLKIGDKEYSQQIEIVR